MIRRAAALIPLIVLAATARAQQAQPPIGTVATRDALVTGGLEVQGEKARLLTNVSVTAYDRTAPIELTRGGEVLVCSTSRFHVLRSGLESSLVFALDRGAIEIHSESQPQDVVMTPDLRITFATTGKLDLRLRVTPNGDTCMENAGASAPVLSVSDAFSDSSYRLMPTQHVLFEHGSLREVVDQERSPCGCPAAAAPSQVANTASPAEQAAARNPFPAAQSQGLAPVELPANNSAPKGEVHVQVASTLTYGDKAGGDAGSAKPVSPVVASVEADSEPPPSPPGAHDLVHVIGHFFRRLFGGNSAAKHTHPEPAR